jgi:signal transduction histidine kinase
MIEPDEGRRSPAGNKCDRGRRLILWLWVVLLTLISTRAGADPVRKVIHQYALTSANDFPQRDPQDWRLLGSNDGGRTWVVLDVRTNEIFPARQQRKFYQISNETPFAMYRLEIDQVRDPATATSVQLAEIELMGQNQDNHGPTPGFTDVISAQGDNPPAETAVNLFDGHIETKWLDWGSDEGPRSSWIQWQYGDPTETIVTNISQLLALRMQAGQGMRVRIEAMVTGRQGNQICLVDPTGCAVLNSIDKAETLEAGRKILLTGASDWEENRVGVRQSHVQFLDSVIAAYPEHISLEQSLSPGRNLVWVKVQGEIQYPHLAGDEISFDIQDGQASMRVHLPYQENSTPLPRPGTWISVSGICLGAFNERGQWVAANLWATGWSSLTNADGHIIIRTSAIPPVPAKQNPVNATTLTTIGQIRRLSHEELEARPHVKIRGIVTDELQGFVQDDTAGIEVTFSDDAKRKIPGFGAYIEIDGLAALDDVGSPEILGNQINVLGKGKLPPPQTFTPSQLASGRFDAQWIEADGVVRSTDGSHLLITCYGQQLTATITKAPVELVNELVDAEVRVCGVGVTARDEQGRVQGIHLLIPSLDYVDLVAPPPDIATLPMQKVGNLSGLSGPGESYHRIKVQGVVTLQQDQRIFFEDDTGNAMAVLKENVVLDARFGRSHWLYWQTRPAETASNLDLIFSPGDRIQVVGFPETHRYSPVLTEAIVTKLGSQQALKPVALTSDGLAEGGLDSSLVTFDGVLGGQTMIGANRVLDLEWQDRTLQVLMPRQENDLFKTQPGSRLRVTGVCQIDPPSYPELGLVPGPVRILTRSPEDLVILARPPWWTVQRALMLVGGMLFVILAGLIWIKELRRQVEERSAQLSTEIQLRERAESHHALEQERARIAKDLHDDLGANLTQIIFLSERVEVARHDGQEVTRWFDLIPATARRTIQSLDEIVWAINPRHDSLESLANYLSQFAQQHLTLAHVRCMLDVPTVLPAVPLSAEVRHNLLLMTREALQNAVTHAEATEVHLALILDEKNLNMTISDNGKGFDPDSVSPYGNGLQNMRQRVQAIGGWLEISSRPGQGTVISFFVPRNMLHGRVIGKNRIPSKD